MTKRLCLGLPTGSTLPQLAIEFYWESDRWRHAIGWLDQDDQFGVWLRSLEGSPAESFPPSPPLQDLDLHQLPGGDAALGVGMAGKSHWSFSISILPCESGDYFLADHACLEKPTVVGQEYWLGSSYLVERELEVIHDGGEVSIQDANRTLSIRQPAAATVDTSIQWDSASQTVSLSPVNRSDQPATATRWQFEIHPGR